MTESKAKLLDDNKKVKLRLRSSKIDPDEEISLNYRDEDIIKNQEQEEDSHSNIYTTDILGNSKYKDIEDISTKDHKIPERQNKNGVVSFLVDLINNFF